MPATLAECRAWRLVIPSAPSCLREIQLERYDCISLPCILPSTHETGTIPAMSMSFILRPWHVLLTAFTAITSQRRHQIQFQNALIEAPRKPLGKDVAASRRRTAAAFPPVSAELTIQA